MIVCSLWMAPTFGLQWAIPNLFVGLCIKTGDICWWNGPYEPGIWNDGMIFEDALVSMLNVGIWREM